MTPRLYAKPCPSAWFIFLFTCGHVSLVTFGLAALVLGAGPTGDSLFSCDAVIRSAAAQAEGEPAGESAARGQVVGEGGLDALPDGLHVFLVQLVVGERRRDAKPHKNIRKKHACTWFMYICIHHFMRNSDESARQRVSFLSTGDTRHL